MARGYFGFATSFVAIFALTVLFLASLDSLPEPLTPKASNVPAHVEAQSTARAGVEPPIRVAAESIGLEREVLNPESTDVSVLDAALRKGAVRYPTSAMLGEEGTVLLFGHSSYLPVVHNSNYKAFNGIQKLQQGDTVSVYSATAEYRYKVTGVRLADANEDVVELPSNGQYLALVTCDSFGTKSDRFVVTARLDAVYEL